MGVCNAHLFGAYLRTTFACSKTEYAPLSQGSPAKNLCGFFAGLPNVDSFETCLNTTHTHTRMEHAPLSQAFTGGRAAA